MPMTVKERWLAAIGSGPVDRLPFWPKLNGAYPLAQTPPFSLMSIDELHAWIGSDPQFSIATGVKVVRRNTSLQAYHSDGTRRTVYGTPAGSVTSVERLDDVSKSWHPVAFPIIDLASLRIMTDWYADERAELDARGLERARARYQEIDQQAVVASTIGTTPLMRFVQHLAGLETAQYLLADHPDEVAGLFAAMRSRLMRTAEIMAEYCPADLLYLSENTSTTLISPAQYRRYSRDDVTAIARIVQDAGRPLVLHMCGYLKAILPDLADVPAAAFEAFTSPTVGDTAFQDGRLACPNTCLVGGTNAALWILPAADIIAALQRDLDVLPHHRGLVVSSAGVMPPACDPATIKEACEWVKSYPIRM